MKHLLQHCEFTFGVGYLGLPGLYPGSSVLPVYVARAAEVQPRPDARVFIAVDL